MLQDINDEPKILKTLSEVYLPKDVPIQNIELPAQKFSKIYIIASGSSRNAGNITKNFIETATKIPVFVEYASEFGERNPSLSKNDLIIFVSQSGETSDVLAALKLAGKNGAYTLAITNNEMSTIHKSATAGIFIHAGKEISIPATKSFIAQLICLYITGICLAEKLQTLSTQQIECYKNAIREMPEKIEKIIKENNEINVIAEKLYPYKSLVILGRGENFGLAEEAALKIKETCYINACGYPSGEFLHGHLAMIDENTPVLSIITKYGQQPEEHNYGFAVKNTLQLIKKRNAKVTILKDFADTKIEEIFSEFECNFLNVAPFSEKFSPVYSAIVLHLLANRMAEFLGNDVNNPRSLSKTVSND